MTIHTTGYVADPDAVYFDLLLPDEPTDRPYVVMIHGGSRTGTCFMTNVSGRSGWAYRFAERGYPVIVPDWPGHGRSGGQNLHTLTGERVSRALAQSILSLAGPVVLLSHSMGGAFGWRIIEMCRDKVVAVVGVAPAPPGNIQSEPEILSEGCDHVSIRTQFRTMTLYDEGASLPDAEFVTSKLIGSSQQFPTEHLDAYTRRLTHTGSRLLYERWNVRGSQLKINDSSCFEGKPVLIVTGDEDLEHPRHVDEKIVDWFLAQGAMAQFAWLPDHGIVGNGHMLMMERNSDQIADWIIGWLDQKASIEAC
jgi:pimeloyl-ACP methyl ester carboxylesterase